MLARMPSSAVRSRGERAADFLIRRRRAYLIFCFVLSVVAFLGAARVRVMGVGSYFLDLLPEHNPIIETLKEYLDFTSPLSVQILVRTKTGTIYTPKTLTAIYKMTRDIDLIPAIDHNTVMSIAASKVRIVAATPGGLESRPVMPDLPPTTMRQAFEIQQKARIAGGVMGILVSPDEKSTLIEAAFHPQAIDYTLVWNRIHEMLRKAKAANPDLEFYPGGRVMMVGWVYHYGEQAMLIFFISFFIIALAHYDYMRSLSGAGTPLIAAAATALWGTGAAGWMGLDLDPLTLVVPVLLTARALSHSIQITRRFYEELYRTGDQLRAATIATRTMFLPAVLGVMCDVIGLYMLMMVPIPIIWRLGLFCGTWSLMIIPTVVLLSPVLLAMLPPPGDVKKFITGENASVSSTAIAPVQRALSTLIKPGWRVGAAFAAVPLALLLFYGATHRQVGSVEQGSPLLWPNNEFNVADRMINRNLAGTVTLNVVWQGNRQHEMKYPPAFVSMEKFQHYIEAHHGAEASLSIMDLLPITNRLLHGGNPKWLAVNPTTENVATDMFFTLSGHPLTDYGQLVRSDLKSGDVILWYKDLKADTVNRALKDVRTALHATQDDAPSPYYKIRLAGGAVAMQYAMNKVVKHANLRIMLYLLAAIFLMSALVYRSFTAAVLLIVPLVLAQFATDSVMYLRGVGLDVNTLPVVAVGLGVGIDYGIYLLSRICDELQEANDGDVYGAAVRALFTAGEAIFFVAFTMVAGVLPWYFLSGLKFLADMGLMLALVMAFNAILALTMLPLEIVLLKPKFLRRVRLMRS